MNVKQEAKAPPHYALAGKAPGEGNSNFYCSVHVCERPQHPISIDLGVTNKF